MTAATDGGGTPKGSFEKLTTWADFFQKLVGLLALIPPLTSWYDPTFFGLLRLNPAIAGLGFKYSALLSVLVLAYLLYSHWEFWRRPSAERGINVRRNLIAAIFFIPLSVALIDATAAYLASHPPTSANSTELRRWLLVAEYVAFVTVSVLLLARIAIGVYPQVKAAPAAPAAAKAEDPRIAEAVAEPKIES